MKANLKSYLDRTSEARPYLFGRAFYFSLKGMDHLSTKIENALYIRSASNSKSSIETQRLIGEKYAKQHSLHLSVFEDSHTHGFTPLNERNGLGRLIRLVEVGLIKTVIVDTLYRISRNGVDLYSFSSLLKQHNAKLIVINGGGDVGK